MTKKQRYDESVAQLLEYLSLSDEAIHIAEGWSLLDDRAKRHVKILIDDHISREIPQLRQYYANVSIKDQERFNRVVERVQDRYRGIPPEDA